MATYVLVHGSNQGGWIWQPVANLLRAAGHQVYAPSLDGCGERKSQMRPGITAETQADEVAQLMFYEDLKDVVLVGTSYGGMVACRTAELMRERISRLVFVDALTLFDGEGNVLAEWREDLGAREGAVVIDSRELRRRFGLGEFAGQLFFHAVGAAGDHAAEVELGY